MKQTSQFTRRIDIPQILYFLKFILSTSMLTNYSNPRIFISPNHYTGLQGFVVEKLRVVSGVIFDVESESGIRISLLRQDFKIFEVMCSKNGGFSLLLRLYTGRKNFFWFFPQISSFSTTLSLQNELLNSYERFFYTKIRPYQVLTFIRTTLWAFTLTLWCIPFCIRKFILKICACGF